MKPITLTNTSHAILWELPPGKPSRSESFSGYGIPDKRTRIMQPAQKGPHCRYYSFLPLRVRIGPIHQASDEEYRSIERVISLWRKEVFNFDLLNYRPEGLTDKYWLGMSECDENLLKAFGINHLHMVLGNMGLSKVWNDSSLFGKAILLQMAQIISNSLSVKLKNKELHKFVTCTMVAKYQLQPSTWTPKQPITSLIQVLKNHGPMAVSGFLGSIYYKSEALLSARKISNRPIYYFPKGAERIQIGEAHVIVLIGAETTDSQDIVYYNDPHDISDPILGKKIYAQSYKTFISAIEGPLIVKTAIYAQEQLRETPEAYGVHAHPTLQPSIDIGAEFSGEVASYSAK